MYSEDTKKLIARDVQAYQAKQKEIAKRIAEAIEGYPDSMIHTALESALFYGFKQSNGEWHPAPKRNSSEVVFIEPEEGDSKSS